MSFDGDLSMNMLDVLGLKYDNMIVVELRIYTCDSSILGMLSMYMCYAWNP